MRDLVFIGLFLVCCAAAGGLVVLCERLMPRDTDQGGKP
jgi:hypothetical protein